MFAVRYELGYDFPEDGILHNHRSENLKTYMVMNLRGSIKRGIL
jgi:hypothetical protein